MSLLRKIQNRAFSTVASNRKHYVPVSFEIKNLASDFDRKILFNKLKSSNLPIKGIRYGLRKSEDGKKEIPVFLADCLYTKKPLPQIIPKIELNGENLIIDFSQITKKQIFEKSPDFEKLQKEINDEEKLFDIKAKVKRRALGAKRSKSGKALDELINEPALQFKIGLSAPIRVYRNRWLRNGYSEPCYWTIVRVVYKKKNILKTPKILGVKTWRGKESDKIERIKSVNKREWRYIRDPQTIALDPRHNPFFETKKHGPYEKSPFGYRIRHCVPKLPKFKPVRRKAKIALEKRSTEDSIIY